MSKNHKELKKLEERYQIYKNSMEAVQNNPHKDACEKMLLLWGVCEKLHALEGDWGSSLFHGSVPSTLQTHGGLHSVRGTKEDVRSRASHFKILCREQKQQAPNGVSAVSSQESPS